MGDYTGSYIPNTAVWDPIEYEVPYSVMRTQTEITKKADITVSFFIAKI